jgi:hypothetical protein
VETIYGSVILRPTRVAFLVRPSQRNLPVVREIIRTSACLWGGMFNPIIPVCNALPMAWRREPYREITGRGLAEAYIRFFEPDVFVEAEAGLAEAAGIVESARIHPKRVLPLKQFVKGEDGRRPDFAAGLSVFDIYEDFYHEEFKFASREPRKVASFGGDDPYCEIVFGDFPRNKKLGYLKRAYMEVCKPDILSATPETCLSLLKDDYLTPLIAGLHKIDVSFDNRDDPAIFIFDPTKTTDLIDFWNLRQFRSGLLPINLHWMGQFTDMARKFVTSNYRPLPGNKNGVMISTTVEFSRSISKTTKDTVTASYFQNLPAGSVSRKDWYDPIWRSDWRGGGIQPRRAKLVADEIDIEESVDPIQPMVRFRCPGPKFAQRYSSTSNAARWANVVKFADYLNNSSFALTFPPNAKGEDFPRLDFAGRSLCSREGVVILRQYHSESERLQLLPQQDAVIGWLKARDIEAKPSSAGRNAEQVLRSIGGARRASLFADEATIRLLDKMAKTIQREADGTTAQYPDRTASIAEWKEVLGRRSNALFSSIKLNDLIKANVMRIGLRLSCPTCDKENWYGLSDIDYNVTCERCLNKYEFPQTDLKFNEGDWRYRVLGPFSVPNYADGAYSTILTLRVFKKTLYSGDTPTTFATGLDISQGALKSEVDFAGWYSEGSKFWVDPSPVVVFGEAKSFGTDVFKERDVQRLKALAEAIPGSYIVFSALKRQLSDGEKSRIRRFAEWGRILQKNGEPRGMVIILTGIELFADHDLRQTWRDLGGAHANMVKHPSMHIDDLWTLSDITQQLYLDLPSYYTWRAKKRRANKRGANKQQNSNTSETGIPK